MDETQTHISGRLWVPSYYLSTYLVDIDETRKKLLKTAVLYWDRDTVFQSVTNDLRPLKITFFRYHCLNTVEK